MMPMKPLTTTAAPAPTGTPATPKPLGLAPAYNPSAPGISAAAGLGMANGGQGASGPAAGGYQAWKPGMDAAASTARFAAPAAAGGAVAPAAAAAPGPGAMPQLPPSLADGLRRAMTAGAGRPGWNPSQILQNLRQRFSGIPQAPMLNGVQATAQPAVPTAPNTSFAVNPNAQPGVAY